MADQLVDMKRSGPDPNSGCNCMPCGPDNDDQYPYGLNISLGPQELAKLGIAQLPAVGAELKGQFVAVVTATRQSVNEDDDTTLSAQIVMLQVAIEAEPAGAAMVPAQAAVGQYRPSKAPANIVS